MRLAAKGTVGRRLARAATTSKQPWSCTGRGSLEKGRETWVSKTVREGSRLFKKSMTALSVWTLTNLHFEALHSPFSPAIGPTRIVRDTLAVGCRCSG